MGGRERNLKYLARGPDVQTKCKRKRSFPQTQSISIYHKTAALSLSVSLLEFLIFLHLQTFWGRTPSRRATSDTACGYYIWLLIIFKRTRSVYGAVGAIWWTDTELCKIWWNTITYETKPKIDLTRRIIITLFITNNKYLASCKAFWIAFSMISPDAASFLEIGTAKTIPLLDFSDKFASAE